MQLCPRCKQFKKMAGLAMTVFCTCLEHGDPHIPEVHLQPPIHVPVTPMITTTSPTIVPNAGGVVLTGYAPRVSSSG